MKKWLKAIVVIVLFGVLMNVASASDWEIRGKQYVRQGLNAMDNGQKLETDPMTVGECPNVKMINFGNKAALCVNCGADEDKKAFPTIECKGTCTIYTGFALRNEKWIPNKPDEPAEPYPEGTKYVITDSCGYFPDKPLLDANNPKVPISIDFAKQGEIVLDKTTGKTYDITEPHVFRLTNAKATFYKGSLDTERNAIITDMVKYGLGKKEEFESRRFGEKPFDSEFLGKIIYIDGISKDGTVWIDGFGIPARKDDKILLIGNSSYMAATLLLIIGGTQKPDDWLDELPKELKDEDRRRSEIKLCGQTFTNYAPGSVFMIQKKGDAECVIPSYTLNTELFVDEDIAKWKEYAYRCGGINYFAMGGKVKRLRCQQEAPKDGVPGVLVCSKGMDCDGNAQKFRIITKDYSGNPDYWLSINERSSFNTVAFLPLYSANDGTVSDNIEGYDPKIISRLENTKDTGMIFLVDELSVSKHIPNTGGPRRYSGDVIGSGEPIMLVYGRDAGYVDTNTDGIYGPQLIVDSKSGLNIYREAREKSYSYEFIAPYSLYALQLGSNVYKAMTPIIGIFPVDSKISASEGKLMYNNDKTTARYDIPILGKIGVNDILRTSKNGAMKELWYGYDTKKMTREEKPKWEKLEMPISLQDYMATRCFDKLYKELDAKGKKRVDELLIASGDSINEQLQPGDIFEMPGTREMKYGDENGRAVYVTLTPKDCPVMQARLLNKAIYENDACLTVEDHPNQGKYGVCVQKADCQKAWEIKADSDYLQVVRLKVSAGEGWKVNFDPEACSSEQVCCRKDKINHEASKLEKEKKKYEKKSLAAKAGRIRDDTPCTKGLKGVCEDERVFNCYDNAFNQQAFVAGRCLKYPLDMNYKCCPGGKLVKKSEEEMIAMEYTPFGSLVQPICNTKCIEILGPDAKKECTNAGAQMKSAQCSTSCTFITGTGCTKIRKCAAGSAAGCEYTLDEVGGKTCDIPPYSEDNKCILRAI